MIATSAAISHFTYYIYVIYHLKRGVFGATLFNLGQFKKQQGDLPSGNLTSLWTITIFNGEIHYKWPFSIATLVITRG
jgi:hypothetical protein